MTERKCSAEAVCSTDRQILGQISPGATYALHWANKSFAGAKRIGLLEAIDRCGSITWAAREVGIGYKTAWAAVDAMNKAAERPLVARAAGGVGGGGTTLTDAGKETLRLFRVVRDEHDRFIRRLEERLGDVTHFYSLMRRMPMRVSARNVLTGRVTGLRKGTVNTEVTLALKGAETLCAVITNESAADLGLREEMEAHAFFKASAVVLGKDLHDVKVGTGNLFRGTVDRVASGAVNGEVMVALPGGSVLTSIVTEESAKRLGLAVGDPVYALVDASNVILGVDA